MLSCDRPPCAQDRPPPLSCPVSPCSYSGGRTLEAFSTFLTEKVQSDAHARVELLDTFASKFLGSADQAGLLAQTEEAVLTLTGGEARLLWCRARPA